MKIDYEKILKLAARLGEVLESNKLSLATAESCTGGWIAHTITSVPNCSSWFERGFVTYSKDSKIELLKVSPNNLTDFGAVSEPIAHEMARGAITNSHAQVSLAITGSAGPDKEDSGVPVGTCWFGWSVKNKFVKTESKYFEGDRISINYQAVEFSLSTLINILKNVL